MRPVFWLGFGLQCSDLSVNMASGQKETEWRFGDSPKIYSVDPDSPADHAGLRRGDILTEIDGVRLDTEEGGRRFSRIEPGQEVVWTVVRGGEKRKIGMLVDRSSAAAAPEEAAEPRGATEAPRSAGAGGSREGARAPRGGTTTDKVVHLRWAGSLDRTRIEVRSLEHVLVKVAEGDREISITAGDATIHLWLED